MKLLFSGSDVCNFETLKRLILLSDEIGFMDRPSITFNNWGTVAVQSRFRALKPAEPVDFSFHTPPSGPVNNLYRNYIEQDLNNYEFRKIVFEGFKNNNSFSLKFINPKDNYNPFTGGEIVQSLITDNSLIDKTYKGDINVEKFFKVDNELGREVTFRLLITEASIEVTNALLISENTGIIPVTDDPYFSKLFFLRTSSNEYIGNYHRFSSMLGMEISKFIIPDELLQKLDFPEIFEYRKQTVEAYNAWDTELNKLASNISDMNTNNFENEIKKILAQEVQPKLVEYNNEMVSVRDRLFGELLKKIVRWEMPTLTLSFFSNMSLSNALFLFAAALTPAVPDVIDYFQNRKEINRNNSFGYLIGLSQKST